MKNEIAARLDNGEAWTALNCVRNDTAPPPHLPHQGGGCKKGFTLIEVVLAIVVIAIAVSATMVVMSKMMGYTINRGQAVDISNAVTVSQIAIDRVRDQKFPPTGPPLGDLTTNDTNVTLSNTVYACHTDIMASDGSGISGIIPAEYGSTNGDSMLGYRNLLKITVTVSKNGRTLLKTVTYKTRNGYY